MITAFARKAIAREIRRRKFTLITSVFFKTSAAPVGSYTVRVRSGGDFARASQSAPTGGV